MILKCPNCGEEYEVQANKELTGFTMKCATCGTEISTEDEVVKITHLKKNTGWIEPTKKPKSKWKWVVAIIVAILAVMVFTKPEKAKHVEKVREMAMGVLSDKVSSNDDDLSEGLAMLFGPFVINQFLELGLQIDDYIFFNVGHFKYEDVDKTLTLGVFNCVFPLAKPNKNQVD